MFALSNGYLGIRGMPEEGRPVREPGVLLNGFHEFRHITYGESDVPRIPSKCICRHLMR
jgi:alpha,alpha-trehalose phosphorylase